MAKTIISLKEVWKIYQLDEVEVQALRGLDIEIKEGEFIDLMVESGIPEDKHNLKIIPPLRIGREMHRSRPYEEKELFTDQCFIDYDFNQLQCSKCRMISENGVWVCPILINEEGARMGDTLEESFRPFPMTYMACWTCRMDGMNCTN